MIQFNLLPDVKLEFIKTQRLKRTVILICQIVGGTALFVLIMMFLLVNVVQKRHLSNLNKDINKYTSELKNTKDIDKILTIQSQLNSLPDLHNKKVVASRLFKYISQLTPAQATMASINIDFVAHKINISGSADNLATVNKFVDTLKFTNFESVDQAVKGQAFSSVVLTGFSKGDSSTTYQISTDYNAVIFDSSSDIVLQTPNIISTRSETEKPADDLFKENEPSQGGGQ
jgi:Tfp pilus assembly protein PilN